MYEVVLGGRNVLWYLEFTGKYRYESTDRFGYNGPVQPPSGFTRCQASARMASRMEVQPVTDQRRKAPGEWHDPPREFSQAPFWFWNDDLTKAELLRQIEDFQSHGIHAFVIHPRAGLPRSVDWLGERMIGFMRFAVREAARRGMWVILYDEGMYPSGSSPDRWWRRTGRIARAD